MKIFQYLFLYFCLFFSSCSPNSQEDFQLETQAVCRLLTEQLQTVKSRDDLMDKMPGLKKIFNRLVDILIEARTYQTEHPELVWNAAAVVQQDWSEALQGEMRRIYNLEGGKELIEEAQRPSLLRLDRFERDLIDKRSIRRAGKAVH